MNTRLLNILFIGSLFMSQSAYPLWGVPSLMKGFGDLPSVPSLSLFAKMERENKEFLAKIIGSALGVAVMAGSMYRYRAIVLPLLGLMQPSNKALATEVLKLANNVLTNGVVDNQLVSFSWDSMVRLLFRNKFSFRSWMPHFLRRVSPTTVATSMAAAVASKVASVVNLNTAVDATSMAADGSISAMGAVFQGLVSAFMASDFNLVAAVVEKITEATIQTEAMNPGLWFTWNDLAQR